jgi:hypothetical protein
MTHRDHTYRHLLHSTPRSRHLGRRQAVYQHHDFVESPNDPMTLILPLATIAAALEQG